MCVCVCLLKLYGYLPSIPKPSELDEQDMWDTAGEIRTNT